MSQAEIETCPCGLPLHYRNPQMERLVRDFVAKKGLNVAVTVSGRTWLVSRHFIALHGLKAAELPELAKRYGFIETTGSQN